MPIQIDAKLNAFRRSSKGFYITLEINPDSDWEDLARAPLGTAFGVAMVPMDPETGQRIDGPLIEASPGTAGGLHAGSHTGQQRIEAGKIRRPFHEMSRAQQAGILCADPTFQFWLSTHPQLPVPAPDNVADAVRLLCGVTSRSELSEDRVAGKKWDQLVTNFYQATGRLAEQRG